MTKNYTVPAGALVTALIGIAFCIWTAFGNDVNICVTTGCTLYQDFKFAGISLWWFGAAAFTILAACEILGQITAGRRLAALFLLGDIGLLLLMALTAPCISCLGVAMLFAISYFLLRRQAPIRASQNKPATFQPSALLWIWLLLFVVNLGQVARSQVDVWPILDESGEAKTRMFFSPSCRYCIEGINVLSGNIDVAFYPLAETNSDVARVEKMLTLIEEGASIAEALGQSQEATYENFWQAFTPNALILRFRMLCNKAHVFAQGSQGVPFFERKGLPPSVLAKVEKRPAPNQLNLPKPVEAVSPSLNPGSDHTLPAELQDGGQCGGIAPCPPTDSISTQ